MRFTADLLVADMAEHLRQGKASCWRVDAAVGGCNELRLSGHREDQLQLAVLTDC